MIRDKKDIALTLEKLKVIWEKYPSLRLGQLITSALDFANIHYLEDDMLIQRLSKAYKVDTENIMIDERIYNEPSLTNKGKVFIHKNDDVKLIPRSELNMYTSKGYSLGMKDK